MRNRQAGRLLHDIAAGEDYMQIDGATIDDLVRHALGQRGPGRAFRATYRLQFTGAHLRFVEAQRLAAYLADLGVSHVYASPFMKSKRGSTHGYDIVDHTRLNDELGTPEEFAAYVSALHEHGLGQILDVVPNHMSVATDENAWWMDVLMNGPASRYAAWFDIDWHPSKVELHEKVLLPILDDRYGSVLEAGRLQVRCRDGAFFVQVGQSLLPLSPKTWASVLTPGIEELEQQLGVEATELLELKSIVTAIAYLPTQAETSPDRIEERHRERIVIQGRLRRLLDEFPQIKSHVELNITALNGVSGNPGSFDALDALLNRQAYRLVSWKSGSDELNYRRFFDVTELAAVCMENAATFEAAHRLAIQLVVDGQVDGFRVDHIDGLFDPAQYLWRLQWAYLWAVGQARHAELCDTRSDAPPWSEIEPLFAAAVHRQIGGPSPDALARSPRDPSAQVTVGAATAVADAASVGADAGSIRHGETIGATSTGEDQLPGAVNDAPSVSAASPARRRVPLFVLVEKILGIDEPLPSDWPVAGTTGYDFLNQVNGLFIDPQGLKVLQQQYARFTELRDPFRDIVYQCKRLILSVPMHSELQLLAHRLDRLSNANRHCRDFTLHALRLALREIIACFPVYRTYIRTESQFESQTGSRSVVSERDRRIINLAVAQAKRRNPILNHDALAFVRDVLLKESPSNLDAAGTIEREFFIGRFQQVTSPVMAKGVEDTAFYRYVPLASVGEVGGEPLHAVTTVDDFHRQNADRLQAWPQAMLTTTTHDTKRTEDVRSRIDTLGEIPGLWRTAVARWTRLNRKHHRDVDGQPAPSRNDEWLFYLTLAGVWPISVTVGPAERETLIARLRQYMEKAIHEAKRHTSWIHPNANYDEAVRGFVSAVLRDGGSRFMTDFQQFVETLVDPGLYTSLAQTLLKFTSPGIPDVYQGQEIWDLSLVDPDNRRPVDFELRRRLLAEVTSQTATPEGRLSLAQSLARSPRDLRTKLFVTRTALQFRKDWPELLEQADYVPLIASGDRTENVCAFAWRSRESETPTGPRVAVVVAPRLIRSLTDSLPQSLGCVPCGAEVWKETTLSMEGLPDATFKDYFTGREFVMHEGRISVGTLLQDFPLALLTN